MSKASAGSGCCGRPARVVVDGRLNALYFWHKAAGDMLDTDSLFQNRSNAPPAWENIREEVGGSEKHRAELITCRAMVHDLEPLTVATRGCVFWRLFCL
jgi:hypothetical protein